jgi:trans-2,3-dihydro-3-hydroxyanthranilate isomerase
VRTLRYALCDVFTERPLEGNPLAVFTDGRSLDARTMQALARELNLSETTFVFPPERGGHARVRIFTPHRELPFAGHPTLGTAFVLGGALELPELRLELEVGIVKVRLEREGARVAFGWMTQPNPRALACDTGPAILDALGVVRTHLPLISYENGPEHALVMLDAAAAVASLTPDFPALARATRFGVSVFHAEGLTCTARYFAPSAGINEDPATGSAVGPIAVFLHERGLLARDATLTISQGVEVGRPSTLYARLVSTEASPALSVEVGGCARVVARGQFTF